MTDDEMAIETVQLWNDQHEDLVTEADERVLALARECLRLRAALSDGDVWVRVRDAKCRWAWRTLRGADALLAWGEAQRAGKA